LEHFQLVKDWKMRGLGISAIVMAATLALLSIIFVGLAYNDGWSGGSVCSVAESLRRRPSLLAIPVGVAMAWGLMVLADAKAASIAGWLKARKLSRSEFQDPSALIWKAPLADASRCGLPSVSSEGRVISPSLCW
jgi:hypothetical protein